MCTLGKMGVCCFISHCFSFLYFLIEELFLFISLYVSVTCLMSFFCSLKQLLYLIIYFVEEFCLPQHTCGSQRGTYVSQLSPCSMWFLGIKLRLLDSALLYVSTLTDQASVPSLCIHILKKNIYIYI